MKLFAVVLLTLICCSAETAPPVVAAEPAEFLVRPQIVYQTITGFGAGMYQGTMTDLAPLSPEKREKAYQLVYGPKGLGLNIIRFHISWTAEPLAANAPLRTKGLRYDWEKDEVTQSVWKAVELSLQHAPSAIVYAVPFTPPVRWKDNGKPNFGGHVAPENYGEYAEYLADFIEYYKTAHGVDIKVLSLQNEPDIAVYWESCRWTGDELRDFLKILSPVLKKHGLQTKLMVSEGSTWDEAWIRAKPALEDPIARKDVAILAAHTYGNYDLVDQGRSLLSEAAKTHDIPVWMSETSVIGPPEDKSIFTALHVAHNIYRDLVEGNASAWIYCFLIFNANFHGSMGVLAPVKENELVVPKRFWAIANYSQFIRPGWKRIKVDGLKFANSAFINPEGDKFAIVALNASVNSRPVTYKFNRSEIRDVRVFQTSADYDLSEIDVHVDSRSEVGFTLAPFSVTTFVGGLQIHDK